MRSGAIKDHLKMAETLFSNEIEESYIFTAQIYAQTKD